MAYLDIKYSDIALLLLRLAVGAIFIYHGWLKLIDISGVQDFFASLGIPFSEVVAWIIALVEFLGGIMAVFGAYAKTMYGLFTVIMLGALILVRLEQGFDAAQLEIVLFAASFNLFILGSGRFSVDYKIETR